VQGGIAYLLGDASSESLGLYPIDNFPRHRVDVWIQATAGGMGGLFLRVRYIDDRFDKQLLLERYTIIDVSGWVKLAPQLRATLRVDNAGDVRYDLRRGLKSQGAVASLSLEGTW
jgi:outer membrane receptor protein involved in Fe transport